MLITHLQVDTFSAGNVVVPADSKVRTLVDTVRVCAHARVRAGVCVGVSHPTWTAKLDAYWTA